MNAPHEQSRVTREAWRRAAGQNGAGKWRIGSCFAPLALGGLLLAQADPAEAQGRRQRQQLGAAPSGTQFIDCPAPGQPLVRIPEIVSAAGKLQGTILLYSGPQRFPILDQRGNPRCVPQFVRSFRAFAPNLPGYEGLIPAGPAGFPEAPPVAPPSDFPDPVPGPTLRARLGDIVQLTFLNQINPNDFGDSIDRGERGQGCDESTSPYPGLDQFPDCFHGSSTGNIHFHGTHTNPTTTGDNVFIEVRPSVRENRQPVVTPESVKEAFDEFFFNCETELGRGPLVQWPYSWSDLPRSLRESQLALLRRYDADPAIKNKLLPVNEAQIRRGAWPQYYIGAFPYCFRLPRYTEQASTPGARPPEPSHVEHVHPGPPRAPPRTLQMGQAPGTHWYHAHKHGSTTINVANGMTGAFIIEGDYDDALNDFYGQGWTRTQPVLVINQLGTSPNLIGGGGPGGPMPFVVNGRATPTIKMRPGEVQLWRVANTASRGAAYVTGFAPKTPMSGIVPGRFEWKQIAQDGVQFKGKNYQDSRDPKLYVAPGNRVDLLVKAPTNAAGQPFSLMVQQMRSKCATQSNVPSIGGQAICSPDDASPNPLLFVELEGEPAMGNQASFIPGDPGSRYDRSFPPFLKDIGDDEIRARKTVVFESVSTVDPATGNTPPPGNPGAMHMIDGHKFDGNIGQVVLLNTPEEWRVENRTVNGGIVQNQIARTDPPGIVDHPFHIHINPFQITELFDPNELLPGTTTYKYIFEGKPETGQCLLDVNNPETWKPCDSPKPTGSPIWWDVFPIPSGRPVFTTPTAPVTAAGTPAATPVAADSLGTPTCPPGRCTIVPGYFKMRSRFVDFTGQYVIHCHILAHEDRGMMTIVQVVPFTTAYSHK
jgi:FtsP/CotA-like multicopper oxidase with cupredoxin domain